MIPQAFEYSVPASLADALAQIDAGAKPLAGGMSLIPLMKLRLASPEKVVDIGRLADLTYIREASGSLHIGAAVTHHAVESSAAVRASCPLLAETAGWIGDVQVRNAGTIGGSVAHADPAADYPAALLALDARIVLASKSGERTVAAPDFFVDTFTTALEPGEIVKEVVVPAYGQGTGGSYQKMLQPASGFAIVGIAVLVTAAGGKIAAARVGVTGLGSKPFRATNAESLLAGGADADKAAAAVPEGVDANSDIHASAAYRKAMAAVYAARAIRAALAKA